MCNYRKYIWKVLNISYQILLKRNLVHLEFRKSLGWILVMLQGLLVAFNLKQFSLFHYHRAQCFLIYSLNDKRVVAPNMPLGLGRIWLIMWLYQCLFSLILHLSVHISAWEDRRCLYFKQSNGWASHLERRCQLRARMVAGEGGRPPLPPNTHTSLRKFSFLVPEFLSGCLNSFSLADI